MTTTYGTLGGGVLAQSGEGDRGSQGVAVTLDPNAATAVINGTVQVGVSVTGAADTSVTFAVARGSINPSTLIYTAPATAGSDTVTATSVADPTKSATVTITVNAIVVTVSPASATVAVGATQQYVASGGTTYTWFVNGIQGGSAQLGTISPTGLYTGGTSNGTLTITATSQGVSGTASVNVTGNPPLSFVIPVATLTGHNTSWNPTYSQATAGNSSSSPSGGNMFTGQTCLKLDASNNPVYSAIDPTKLDDSLNSICPANVSTVSVRTLMASFPNLRWFAHVCPWWGSSSHQNVGVNNNTNSYVASMVTYLKACGFSGVVIDWYGSGSYVDSVTLKLQSYLTANPGLNFKFMLCVDKGAITGTGTTATNSLISALQYANTQYFSDANYETVSGMPEVAFFGVPQITGISMSTAKAAVRSGNMKWVEQNTAGFTDTWADAAFPWPSPPKNGVVPTDLYQLADSTFFLSKRNGKPYWGMIYCGFNGTATRAVSWSLGKYIQQDSGKCWLQVAGTWNTNGDVNMEKMQVVTLDDFQEGTAIEGGIENNIVVAASVATNTLTWTVSGGTGDETTLDHYEVYATIDNLNYAKLGNDIAIGATKSLNLTTVGLSIGTTYHVGVRAVGKGLIRNHMSTLVNYTR